MLSNNMLTIVSILFRYADVITGVLKTDGRYLLDMFQLEHDTFVGPPHNFEPEEAQTLYGKYIIPIKRPSIIFPTIPQLAPNKPVPAIMPIYSCTSANYAHKPLKTRPPGTNIA